MNNSFERYVLKISPYQYIYPIGLSVVKLMDNGLMGYFKYERACYGIRSSGAYCSLRMEKKHGFWKMYVLENETEKLIVFSSFIEAMNQVVFEHLKIDFDECVQSLREFEKRDIVFYDIAIKIHGTNISTMDDKRERKKVNASSIFAKFLNRTTFFST